MNAVDTVLQNAVPAGDVSFAVAMVGNSNGIPGLAQPGRV